MTTGGDIGIDLKSTLAIAMMLVSLTYWCIFFWSELAYAFFKNGPTRSKVRYWLMGSILVVMLLCVILTFTGETFSIWPWLPAYSCLFISCFSTMAMYFLSDRMYH